MSNKEDTFVVEDMMCDNCINTITRTLTNNDKISDVKADLSNKEVSVTYDDQLDVEEILSSLDNIGFPATIKKKL